MHQKKRKKKKRKKVKRKKEKRRGHLKDEQKLNAQVILKVGAATVGLAIQLV